jgi:glyceraldehyde-3-phosphate dehydrogenase (NADP+)
VKKLSLELGASCPVVILPDADVELAAGAIAAGAIAAGGYINAGQVCISVQRVIAHPRVHGDLLDALVPLVAAIPYGDPSQDGTRLGTLISEVEARRVEGALRAAVDGGATLLTGGQREGAVVTPAVVDGVAPTAPLNQEELFGPAVAITTAEDWTAAIAYANSTPYGLGAGVFTKDVSAAVRAMRKIDAGVIHINWTPLWRATTGRCASPRLRPWSCTCPASTASRTATAGA